MIERIIEIADQSAFLSLNNNLLSIRLPDRQIVTVPVGEVQCLLLANPAITVTGALLAALAENNAVVVISGKDRLPMAMQLPLKGNYIQNERFRSQAESKLPLRKRLWQVVVQAKLRSQGRLLQKLHVCLQRRNAGSNIAHFSNSTSPSSGNPAGIGLFNIAHFSNSTSPSTEDIPTAVSQNIAHFSNSTSPS